MSISIARSVSHQVGAGGPPIDAWDVLRRFDQAQFVLRQRLGRRFGLSISEPWGLREQFLVATPTLQGHEALSRVWLAVSAATPSEAAAPHRISPRIVSSGEIGEQRQPSQHFAETSDRSPIVGDRLWVGNPRLLQEILLFQYFAQVHALAAGSGSWLALPFF